MNYKLQIVISLFFLLWGQDAIAQYENVWIFGRRAGLDFNVNPPAILSSYMSSNEACASVCDARGKLLFYTDGGSVFDRRDQIMEYGENLTLLSTKSTTQGALIVPFPEHPDKYYIFSLSAIENEKDRGRLSYSVVDMQLNGGYGAVVTGQKNILLDSNLTEQMTGVAGRSCDVWLLVISEQDTLKAYNIDYRGINRTPVMSPLLANRPGNDLYKNIGSLCVSNDRSSLALARSYQLSLYDFDALRGQATDGQDLSTPQSEYYAACFSPDNSKLYTSKQAAGSGTTLEQYDLNAAIPLAVNVLPPGGYVGGALKPGPDGQIYCANGFGRYLSVIRKPDLAGTACQLDYLAFTFSSSGNPVLGLPNAVPHIIPEADTLSDTLFRNDASCFQSTYVLEADPEARDLVWGDGSTETTRVVNASGIYKVSFKKHCRNYAYFFDVSFPNARLPYIQVMNSCNNSPTGGARAISPPDDTVARHYTWMDNNYRPLSATDSVSALAPGSYFLHIHTLTCDTLLPFSVPEEAVRHKVSFAADSLVCTGTVLGFKNTSDRYFEEFRWSFGDGETSVLQNPQHTYREAGSYTCMLIGKGSVCQDTAYHTIIADAPAPAPYFSTGKKSICAGDPLLFSPVSDSSAVALLWDFGDGSYRTGSPGAAQQHHYDQPGSLMATLTASYRICPDQVFRDSLEVHSLPEIDLGSDTSICPNGLPLMLTNRHPGVSGETFLWNTGDTTSRLKVTRPGHYSLSLYSAYSCAATASVEVRKGCFMDIPNAFTPDGDGINDYFFPRSLLSVDLASFSMQIRNRWGALIFTTLNSNGSGWDGRFNGTTQPQGVYIYSISITTNKGQKEEYHGNLTLLR